MNLDGKVIIVAGGSGGIGSAACKLLASKGARVIIVCRASSQLIELVGELGETDSKFVFIEKDLTELNEWENLISIVSQKFGKIDTLINSIGMITPGRIIDLSQKDIQNYIQTNLLSIIYGCKAVLPIMLKQQFGHIIIVGSLGGIIPMPYRNVYCSTKFGVRGFCLSLAEELKNSGISLSLISPGPVRTKLLDLEATDNNTALTFALSVLDPKYLAQKIFKVIEHPKKEVVLPPYISLLSNVVNLKPKFFKIIFPALNKVGQYRLRKYQNKYLFNNNLL